MFNPYTKAILGAMLAMFASVAGGVEDGSRLTASETVTAVIVGLGALGAIWAAHAVVKWLVTGVVAALGALVTALEDGSGLSAQEGVVIAVAALTALMAVYATANTTASAKPKVL